MLYLAWHLLLLLSDRSARVLVQGCVCVCVCMAHAHTLFFPVMFTAQDSCSYSFDALRQIGRIADQGLGRNGVRDDADTAPPSSRHLGCLVRRVALVVVVVVVVVVPRALRTNVMVLVRACVRVCVCVCVCVCVWVCVCMLSMATNIMFEYVES